MRKTIPTLGVVSAGLLLAGSPAQAVDTDMTTAINVGIANGIQANLPIQVPVNVCGNAIALLGTASAYCTGSATANYAPGHRDGYGGNNSTGGDTDMLSAINVGIADGIQADALVQVPVNVCGNAIAILGGPATASCTSTGATANAFTDGQKNNNFNGNNVYNGPGRPIVPVRALPVAAPAKAKPLPTKLRVSAAKPRKTEVGLLANLLQPVTGLLGGGKGNNGQNGGGDGGSCGNVNMTSIGNVGIANGIQAHAPIQIPINFSGNAIAIGGAATASSTGGATANYC